MAIHKIISAGLFCSLLFSCSSSSGEVQMKPLNGRWPAKAVQVFEFNVTAPQEPKNIIFVVRNNEEYPYSNIRFLVNFTDLKTKKIQTDTLNYILARPNGEWIGSGFGDTHETHFQYRLDYQFPAAGKYRIAVTQAMRNNVLPGIEDIGVILEKAKP